jgi:hypothetical protein
VDLEQLRVRLIQIEQLLLELKTRQARTSFSAPAEGRVVLNNDYVDEVQFTVNGETYRVAPGASVVLPNIPAGALRYEMRSAVYGLRASRTTELAAGQTLTLVAHQ